MSPAAKAASSPATIVVELSFEKETPGTNRYKEDVDEGERGTIGTLYVLKKELAKLKNTKRIRVTIEGIG